MNSPKDYLTDRVEALRELLEKQGIDMQTEDGYQIFCEQRAFLTETITQSMEVGEKELIRKIEERLVGLCGTIHHEPFPECEQCNGMVKVLKVIKALSPKP